MEAEEVMAHTMIRERKFLYQELLQIWMLNERNFRLNNGKDVSFDKAIEIFYAFSKGIFFTLLSLSQKFKGTLFLFQLSHKPELRETFSSFGKQNIFLLYIFSS